MTGKLGHFPGWIAACLILFGAGAAAGQGLRSAKETEETTRAAQLRAETKAVEVTALEEPIDPATYVLGPGDLLAVSFRGGVDLFQEVRVSPVGTLLLPKVPPLHVGGMTLAAATEMISNRWGEIFPNGRIDVSLVELRTFRVTVAGAVLHPGTYVVSAADRAATLVEKAGGTLEETASHRRATLEHSDGRVEHVDLLRVRNYGSREANPRLTDGARLQVESLRDDALTIQVGGGVDLPGEYEWVPGDRLLDVIEVAGGFVPEGDPGNIQLTRFDETGGEQTRLEFDATRLIESGERGPEIEPGDLVNVRIRPDRPRRTSVTVTGEVRYPGTYPIVEGVTRLSDIIEAAGGFTAKAYLPAATVWRERDPEDVTSVELARIDSLRLSGRTGISYFEREFLKFNERALRREYFSVDFGKIFEEGEKALDEDLLLEDDMVVEVPDNPRMVLLLGQVRRPGYYPHHEGYGYKDYVREAGGFLKNGYKSRTRVIKYTSAVWLKPKGHYRIDPGDIILVPEKSEATTWAQFMNIFTLVTQTVTVLALVINISRI